MDFEQLKSDILELLDDLEVILHKVSLDQIRSFVSYNELKLSLEFLCEYIYEDQIVLETKYVTRINEFCEILKVEKTYWLDTEGSNSK